MHTNRVKAKVDLANCSASAKQCICRRKIHIELTKKIYLIKRGESNGEL